MEIWHRFSLGLWVTFTLYFSYKEKSSCILLLVVFLMNKGNKKLIKRNILIFFCQFITC